MAGEWMMKDDFERIETDRSELTRLRAELARVRSERDRVIADLLGVLQVHLGSDDLEPGNDFIDHVMGLALAGDPPSAELAAVLAEHDRRSEGER